MVSITEFNNKLMDNETKIDIIDYITLYNKKQDWFKFCWKITRIGKRKQDKYTTWNVIWIWYIKNW